MNPLKILLSPACMLWVLQGIYLGLEGREMLCRWVLSLIRDGDHTQRLT